MDLHQAREDVAVHIQGDVVCSAEDAAHLLLVIELSNDPREAFVRPDVLLDQSCRMEVFEGVWAVPQSLLVLFRHFVLIWFQRDSACSVQDIETGV